MDMEFRHGMEREILEVALAAEIADVKSLLSPVFGVAADEIIDLHTDAEGEPIVRYELMTIPGRFRTKLTLYVDPARANGVTTDDALAKALVTATADRAVASLPAGHPDAEVPTAWMLYAPGAIPRIVHETPRDDDGIGL